MAGAPLPYSRDELSALAKHCTDQETNAAKVERRVMKSAAALLLVSRIGRAIRRARDGRLRQGHLGPYPCSPRRRNAGPRLRGARRRAARAGRARAHGRRARASSTSRGPGIVTGRRRPRPRRARPESNRDVGLAVVDARPDRATATAGPARPPTRAASGSSHLRRVHPGLSRAPLRRPVRHRLRVRALRRDAPVLRARRGGRRPGSPRPASP